MAVDPLTLGIGAVNLLSGLIGAGRRLNDRSGQERIRRLLQQAQERNAQQAAGIAGSGVGVNPALAQRQALEFLGEANERATESAMAQESQMAVEDRARRDRIVGGLLGSLGGFGATLLESRRQGKSGDAMGVKPTTSKSSSAVEAAPDLYGGEAAEQPFTLGPPPSGEEPFQLPEPSLTVPRTGTNQGPSLMTPDEMRLSPQPSQQPATEAAQQPTTEPATEPAQQPARAAAPTETAAGLAAPRPASVEDAEGLAVPRPPSVEDAAGLASPTGEPAGQPMSMPYTPPASRLPARVSAESPLQNLSAEAVPSTSGRREMSGTMDGISYQVDPRTGYRVPVDAEGNPTIDLRPVNTFRTHGGGVSQALNPGGDPDAFRSRPIPGRQPSPTDTRAQRVLTEANQNLERALSNAMGIVPGVSTSARPDLPPGIRNLNEEELSILSRSGGNPSRLRSMWRMNNISTAQYHNIVRALSVANSDVNRGM